MRGCRRRALRDQMAERRLDRGPQGRRHPDRVTAAGALVDRERALDALLDRLARRLAATAGGDTTPLLRDYRARDALSGARVAWREGDARIAGDARGIDEHGNLVVFTD